jgi:hypothetical protein
MGLTPLREFYRTVWARAVKIGEFARYKPSTVPALDGPILLGVELPQSPLLVLGHP